MNIQPRSARMVQKVSVMDGIVQSVLGTRARTSFATGDPDPDGASTSTASPSYTPCFVWAKASSGFVRGNPPSTFAWAKPSSGFIKAKHPSGLVRANAPSVSSGQSSFDFVTQKLRPVSFG
jgi:hypothetical protein